MSQLRARKLFLSPSAVLVAAAPFVLTWSLVTALIEIPDSGVLADDPGGAVQSVVPGGPGWRAGIRPGQRVVALRANEHPEEWWLRTAGASGAVDASTFGDAEQLRSSTPFALFGLVLAGAAVLIRAVGSWRGSSGIAVVAIAVGTVPLALSGNQVASSIGFLAPLLAASLLIGGVVPGFVRVRLVLVTTGLGIAALFLVSRHAAPAIFDAADGARVAAAWVLVPLSAVVAAGRAHSARLIGAIGLVRFVDLVIVSTTLGIALGAWLALGIPGPAVAIGVAGAVSLLPKWRTRIVMVVDRLFVADLRERSSIAAVESERARVARNIHDAPLQDLASVIRRLELVPEATGEAETLRNVADQLRRVATDLRPPVLDDLGLGPALEFSAQRANMDPDSPVRVTVQLDDETGLEPGERPPRDVELAVFRIANEAIANARQHSSGSCVMVSGEVSPEFVELSIDDDGVGLDEAATQEALLEGHLGMSSMRQRAKSVGVLLSLARSPTGGTRVKLRWEAE